MTKEDPFKKVVPVVKRGRKPDMDDENPDTDELGNVTGEVSTSNQYQPDPGRTSRLQGTGRPRASIMDRSGWGNDDRSERGDKKR